MSLLKLEEDGINSIFANSIILTHIATLNALLEIPIVVIDASAAKLDADVSSRARKLHCPVQTLYWQN